MGFIVYCLYKGWPSKCVLILHFKAKTNHEPIYSDSHWAHLIKEKTKEFVDVEVIFFPFIQHHVVEKFPCLVSVNSMIKMRYYVHSLTF